VAGLWFQTPLIGVAIGAAMVFTFLCAGLIGILTPLMLKRIGVDPAVASAVFVLTFIDLTGFFVFLGLATLILI
jgi:magnesium transporter